MTTRISYTKITIVFLLLYIFSPIYFNILILNFRTILCLVYGFLVATKLPEKKLHIRIVGCVLLLWVLFKSFFMMTAGAYMAAVSLLLVTIVPAVGINLFINTKEKFISALFAVVNVSGLLCILGIIESVTSFNFFAQYLNFYNQTINYNTPRLGLNRIISFTSMTISYGCVLIVIGSIILYLISLETNKNKVKKLKLIYILVCINSFLTVSRSSIALFVISQIIILFYMGKVLFIKRAFLISILVFFLVMFLLLVFPELQSLLLDVFYMFALMFNDSYANMFNGESVAGSQERLLLFSSTWESVQDNLFFGNGFGTEVRFVWQRSNGIYKWDRIKTSLENQWLLTLYYYGISGVLLEFCAYIALFKMCLKNIFKLRNFEKSISFNFIFFVCFASYQVMFFSIAQMSEIYTFYALAFLLFAYNKNHIGDKK